MASSCLELKIDGENTDGLYLIDVSGFGPLTVYCDMTTDGGGWTQLYDQDVASGYDSVAAWAGGVNLDQPNMGHYSILQLIGAFEGVTPGFEFLLEWPNQGGFVQWQQSENPFVGRGIVSNVIQSPSNQLGCVTAPAFGGLAADNDGTPDGTVESTLDGSTDECWWWAVGTSGPPLFADGVPTYANAAPGSLRAASRARLWVR